LTCIANTNRILPSSHIRLLCACFSLANTDIDVLFDHTQNGHRPKLQSRVVAWALGDISSNTIRVCQRCCCHGLPALVENGFLSRTHLQRFSHTFHNKFVPISKTFTSLPLKFSQRSITIHIPSLAATSNLILGPFQMSVTAGQWRRMWEIVFALLLQRGHAHLLLEVHRHDARSSWGHRSSFTTRSGALSVRFLF